MRKTILNFAILAALALGIASCGSNSGGSGQNVAVQAEDNIPGFDVQAFAQLLKTCTDPDALTQQLNAPNSKINNLDLDGDNNTDYLKVDQVDANTLTVNDETKNGKVLVATLTVNPQQQTYVINGTPDYCGTNYQYAYQPQPGITFGQLLFLHYMLMPHPYFYHPHWGYGVGYYGGYHPYHSYYGRPYTSGYARGYQQRVRTQTTMSKNPNYRPGSNNRGAAPNNGPKPSLSNPQKSQTQFRANGATSFKNAGGSGNGFKAPAPAARSGGGFGGGSRSGGFGSSSGGHSGGGGFGG